MSNRQPQKMWLLTDCSYDHADFLHASELNFYFSPHTNCFCDKLIDYYNGQKCRAPDLTKLYAAAGDHESFWSHGGIHKTLEPQA